MRWLLVFLFFLSGCGPEVDLGDAVLVPGTDMVCAYGSPGASISISPDGEWLVFIESILLHAEYTKKYPGRGNVFPPRNRLSSINLTTGEKTEHAMPDGTPADQHMIIVTMFSPSGWRDGKFYSHTAPKNNMEVVVDPHKRIVDLERGASKPSCSDCSANTQSNRIYLDDPPDYPFQDRTIFDERVSPDRKYLAYVLGVAIRNVLALNHRGHIYIMYI